MNAFIAILGVMSRLGNAIDLAKRVVGIDRLATTVDATIILRPSP